MQADLPLRPGPTKQICDTGLDIAAFLLVTALARGVVGVELRVFGPDLDVRIPPDDVVIVVGDGFARRPPVFKREDFQVVERKKHSV